MNLDPAQPSSDAPVLWARVDDTRGYSLVGDPMTYDGMVVMATLRDLTGTEHLALLAEETDDSLAYLVAQLDPATLEAAWAEESGRLRARILAAPRTARLRLTFGADGTITATESVVPADQLSDDELPNA